MLSYTDAYGETYTYDYDYMCTTIENVDQNATWKEYYDSYMYVYKSDLPAKINGITERRYYRPDGKNYGEVVQELNSDTKNMTTYIRDL